MLRFIKKITLASFLLGALVGAAQAQTCGSTSNGISTNPTNPTNPLCPSRLNTFDWRDERWPLYWAPSSMANAPHSPFYNESLCADDATGLGVLRKGSQSDFQPADGWELIHTSINDATPTGWEFVALYNRYTSIVRILFVTNENTHTFNYKYVSLAFNNSTKDLTAMYWPTRESQYAQAMDAKSISGTSKLIFASNVNDCYMYVDVPVEYDPCTCARYSDKTLNFSMKNIIVNVNQRDTVVDVYPSSLGFSISLPGGKTTLCDRSDPYYNEVLGRFALFETPKGVIEKVVKDKDRFRLIKNVKFVDSKDAITNEVGYSYQGVGFLPAIRQSEIYTERAIDNTVNLNTRFTSYRFSIDPSTIKYKFNPAANIDKTNTTINAALVIKIKDPKKCSANLVKFLENFEEDGNGSGQFISKVLPLNCVENGWGILNLPRDFSADDFSVYLKLFVSFQFKGLGSNGLPPKVEQVYTYPMNMSFESKTSLDKRPIRDLNYQTSATTSRSISNDVSNTVVIEGFNTITISHNIAPRDGQTVIFRAPVINVSSDVILPSNVILERMAVTSGYRVIPESELGSFCFSATYKGNLLEESNTNNGSETKYSKPDLFVNVYPNPFKETLVIDYSWSENEQVDLTFYNILGQRVQVAMSLAEHRAGVNKIFIKGDALASGVYFVNFKSETENKTIKVIKE